MSLELSSNYLVIDLQNNIPIQFILFEILFLCVYEHDLEESISSAL